MKSKVVLVRINPRAKDIEIEGSVWCAIGLLGGCNAFARSGATVLVKPKFSTTSSRGSATPAVVTATAKIFAREGCNVFIGEDPAVKTDENKIYKRWDIDGLARQSGAQVITLRHSPHRRVSVPRPLHFPEIEVSNFALDADLVISVARMKTSNASHVSLSLKNIQGVITPEWKRALQCQGLNQGIADLNQVVRPRMAIIDGLYAQDQNAGMVVKPVGLIIASDDLVAADATCARIMGFEPRSIEHIAWSENVGLGTTRAEDIEILGEPLENVIGRFSFAPPIDPYQAIKNSMGGIEIIEGEGCSSCLNELGAELRRFEEFMPYFKDVAILVGTNAPIPANKKHIILYGNCLSEQYQMGTLVNGCPPTMVRSAGTGSLGKVLSKILKENSLRSLLARDVDL